MTAWQCMRNSSPGIAVASLESAAKDLGCVMRRLRSHTAADYVVMQQFGAALRRVRTDAEVRRQTLADDIGYSVTSVVNIENGYQNPPLTVIARIADALDVPPSVIFRRGGL